MLFSKILTYALNAYLDAQIAEELIIYIRTKGKRYATKNTIAQQRAIKFVSTANTATFKKDPSYLIGIAYTQYYLNGLADILYTDLLWPVVISKQKPYLQQLYRESISRFCQQLTTPYLFEEVTHKPGIFIWYWPLVVINPWQWVTQFARERCHYNGKLNKDALRKASLEVQYQNSQNNLQVAHTLKTKIDSNDPKVIELRKVAGQLNNDPSFLSQAAATQEAAARWDKLFTFLLSFS